MFKKILKTVANYCHSPEPGVEGEEMGHFGNKESVSRNFPKCWE